MASDDVNERVVDSVAEDWQLNFIYEQHQSIFAAAAASAAAAAAAAAAACRLVVVSLGEFCIIYYTISVHFHF